MHKLIKYRTPALTGKGRVFSYMMFFYALAVALLSPVFPQYLEHITGSEFYVGVFVAISSCVTLFMSVVVSKILHKVSRMFLLHIGFLGMALMFFGFFLIDQFHVAALFQVLKGMMVSILFVVIPLMVRDYTDKKTLAQEEGVYYWFINLAWILGPLIGGVLAYFFGIKFIFLVSMLVVLVAILFLRHEHVVEIGEKEDEKRENVFLNIKEFFARAGLRKAYLVDLGLYVWWSVATICVPLYLAFNGFAEFAIGLILAVKLMPLIVCEKWIGRHVKESELGKSIRRGFMIMVLAILLIALVDNVYFSIGMLLLASVGAAFIEPVKETYLFKSMKRSEENDLFPVYSTARQVGYLIGPSLGGFIIAFFGYQALFLATGFGLLPMILIGHLITKE